jgi:hypothetical protein
LASSNYSDTWRWLQTALAKATDDQKGWATRVAYWTTRRLTALGSAGGPQDSLLPLVQLGETLLGVLEERPTVPFFPEGHEFPVGIGSAGASQAL